jgi:acyl-coenzyme A thioesterase PaaI-like protein
MISTLLDGAMTQCLLARGVPGLTAKLEVRFLKPVRVGRPAQVSGWLLKSRGRLHDLEAVLAQDDEVIVRAWGRFMEFPGEEATKDEGGGR